MKNFIHCFYFVLMGAVLFSCSHLSIKEIEARSYPGFCKNEGGQDLTAEQCNEKMMREAHPPAKRSQSETMMQHVNEDLQKRGTDNTNHKTP